MTKLEVDAAAHYHLSIWQPIVAEDKEASGKLYASQDFSCNSLVMRARALRSFHICVGRMQHGASSPPPYILARANAEFTRTLELSISHENAVREARLQLAASLECEAVERLQAATDEAEVADAAAASAHSAADAEACRRQHIFSFRICFFLYACSVVGLLFGGWNCVSSLTLPAASLPVISWPPAAFLPTPNASTMLGVACSYAYDDEAETLLFSSQLDFSSTFYGIMEGVVSVSVSTSVNSVFTWAGFSSAYVASDVAVGTTNNRSITVTPLVHLPFFSDSLSGGTSRSPPLDLVCLPQAALNEHDVALLFFLSNLIVSSCVAFLICHILDGFVLGCIFIYIKFWFSPTLGPRARAQLIALGCFDRGTFLSFRPLGRAHAIALHRCEFVCGSRRWAPRGSRSCPLSPHRASLRGRRCTSSSPMPSRGDCVEVCAAAFSGPPVDNALPLPPGSSLRQLAEALSQRKKGVLVEVVAHVGRHGYTRGQRVVCALRAGGGARGGGTPLVFHVTVDIFPGPFAYGHVEASSTPEGSFCTQPPACPMWLRTFPLYGRAPAPRCAGGALYSSLMPTLEEMDIARGLFVASLPGDHERVRDFEQAHNLRVFSRRQAAFRLLSQVLAQDGEPSADLAPLKRDFELFRAPISTTWRSYSREQHRRAAKAERLFRDLCDRAPFSLSRITGARRGPIHALFASPAMAALRAGASKRARARVRELGTAARIEKPEPAANVAAPAPALLSSQPQRAPRASTPSDVLALLRPHFLRAAAAPATNSNVAHALATFADTGLPPRGAPDIISIFHSTFTAAVSTEFGITVHFHTISSIEAALDSFRSTRHLPRKVALILHVGVGKYGSVDIVGKLGDFSAAMIKIKTDTSLGDAVAARASANHAVDVFVKSDAYIAKPKGVTRKSWFNDPSNVGAPAAYATLEAADARLHVVASLIRAPHARLARFNAAVKRLLDAGVPDSDPRHMVRPASTVIGLLGLTGGGAGPRAAATTINVDPVLLATGGGGGGDGRGARARTPSAKAAAAAAGGGGEDEEVEPATRAAPAAAKKRGRPAATSTSTTPGPSRPSSRRSSAAGHLSRRGSADEPMAGTAPPPAPTIPPRSKEQSFQSSRTVHTKLLSFLRGTDNEKRHVQGLIKQHVAALAEASRDATKILTIVILQACAAWATGSQEAPPAPIFFNDPTESLETFTQCLSVQRHSITGIFSNLQQNYHPAIVAAEQLLFQRSGIGRVQRVRGDGKLVEAEGVSMRAALFRGLALQGPHGQFARARLNLRASLKRALGNHCPPASTLKSVITHSVNAIFSITHFNRKGDPARGEPVVVKMPLTPPSPSVAQVLQTPVCVALIKLHREALCHAPSHLTPLALTAKMTHSEAEVAFASGDGWHGLR